jgi:hypothetical protein
MNFYAYEIRDVISLDQILTKLAGKRNLLFSIRCMANSWNNIHNANAKNINLYSIDNFINSLLKLH